MPKNVGSHMSLEGHKQLQQKFAKLRDLSPTLAKEEVMAGVLDIQRIAKRHIKEHGKGRKYTLRGVTHQASAPWDPPATNLGGLATRLSAADAIQQHDQGLVASFGPRNYPIASYLEFGTSKMKPRPFLFRSFEEARPKIVRNIGKAIQRFLKSIGKSA